jgi:hypothetical protein
MTPRRQDATMTLAATLLSLGVLAPWRALPAQIGHDPTQSPFRDIRRGAGPVLLVGHLGGDRGRAGAGPSNALTVGLRYDLSLSRPVVFFLSATYAKGDRFILNPAVDSTSPDRRTGPVDTELLLTELGLQLRLSGGKSWRGFAPYLGVTSGIAFDLNSPGDTTQSGYRFGTKLFLSGTGGIRWHAARRLTVQADTRALFWRLNYPLSFHVPAPDGSLVVPFDQPLRDWSVHPWISLGVGWTF